MLGFGHSRGGRRAYRGIIDSPRGESIFATGVPKSIIRCAVARLKFRVLFNVHSLVVTDSKYCASAFVIEVSKYAIRLEIVCSFAKISEKSSTLIRSINVLLNSPLLSGRQAGSVHYI